MKRRVNRITDDLQLQIVQEYFRHVHNPRRVKKEVHSITRLLTTKSINNFQDETNDQNPLH